LKRSGTPTARIMFACSSLRADIISLDTSRPEGSPEDKV
jgi:hypothetical protein